MRDRAIDAAARERAAQWEQAALSAHANPTEQGHLAQVWRVSSAWVRVLAEVWRAFDGLVIAQERPFAWHVAVWRAARRSAQPVGTVLDEALSSEWSVRDLAQVGRAVEAVSLATVCGGCGFRVVVSLRQAGARAAFRGKVARCPVCPVEQVGRLG